jgi:hypothetical protein
VKKPSERKTVIERRSKKKTDTSILRKKQQQQHTTIESWLATCQASSLRERSHWDWKSKKHWLRPEHCDNRICEKNWHREIEDTTVPESSRFYRQITNCGHLNYRSIAQLDRLFYWIKKLWPIDCLLSSRLNRLYKRRFTKPIALSNRLPTTSDRQATSYQSIELNRRETLSTTYVLTISGAYFPETETDRHTVLTDIDRYPWLSH